MFMSFEEFTKKIKAIPKYRLLSEREVRMLYNDFRLSNPTPEEVENRLEKI
jgi:hypothetical protein